MKIRDVKSVNESKHHPNAYPWTPQQVEYLTLLVNSGHISSVAATRMSDKFGIPLTKAAVIGKADRLGLRWGASRNQRDRHKVNLHAARQRAPNIIPINQGGKITLESILIANRINGRKGAAVTNGQVKAKNALPPLVVTVRSVEPGSILLEALTRSTCKFPLGTDVPQFFCGKPTIEDTSWCERCAGWVYEPRSAFEKRKSVRDLGRTMRRYG